MSSVRALLLFSGVKHGYQLLSALKCEQCAEHAEHVITLASGASSD